MLQHAPGIGFGELGALHHGMTEHQAAIAGKIDADYDANDRLAAMTFLQKHAAKGQVVTGLLYVDPDSEDLHTHLDTVETPLNTLEAKDLCPGTAALEKINASLR